MIYRLFPQLPSATARALAAAYASADISTLRTSACNHHPEEIFSPIGGQQMSRGELDDLASEVRRVCDSATPATVDVELTRAMHPRMQITRHEAALEGVWAFLACVLLPEVARWRFGGEATPSDRFIGAGRGVRNVFGRAWWRGELLLDPSPPPGRDSYWLVEALGEDELTGIIERQRAVASRRVAVAIARALIDTNCEGVRRTEVAREAFKHYLRLGYFIEFDALESDELEVACQSLYRKAVKALVAREGQRS
jgi:hypothetical protein